MYQDSGEDTRYPRRKARYRDAFLSLTTCLRHHIPTTTDLLRYSILQQANISNLTIQRKQRLHFTIQVPHHHHLGKLLDPFLPNQRLLSLANLITPIPPDPCPWFASLASPLLHSAHVDAPSLPNQQHI